MASLIRNRQYGTPRPNPRVLIPYNAPEIRLLSFVMLLTRAVLSILAAVYAGMEVEASSGHWVELAPPSNRERIQPLRVRRDSCPSPQRLHMGDRSDWKLARVRRGE